MLWALEKKKYEVAWPTGIGNLIEINNYNDFILYSEEDLNRWGLARKRISQ